MYIACSEEIYFHSDVHLIFLNIIIRRFYDLHILSVGIMIASKGLQSNHENSVIENFACNPYMQIHIEFKFLLYPYANQV